MSPTMNFALMVATLIGGVAASVQLGIWAYLRAIDSTKSESPAVLIARAFDQAEQYADPDQIASVKSFCEKVLCETALGSINREVYNGIDVSLFSRTFILTGMDVTTRETYNWTATKQTGILDFPIVQMGSNIGTPTSISARAAEISDGRRIFRGLRVLHRTDRLLQWGVRLGKRARLGTTHVIEYEDIWPNAMLPGWDAVLVPHACYFSRPINQLVLTLDSDKPLLFAFCHAIDLETGLLDDIELAESQDGTRHLVEARFMPKRRQFVVLIFKRAA